MPRVFAIEVISWMSTSSFFCMDWFNESAPFVSTAITFTSPQPTLSSAWCTPIIKPPPPTERTKAFGFTPIFIFLFLFFIFYLILFFIFIIYYLFYFLFLFFIFYFYYLFVFTI